MKRLLMIVASVGAIAIFLLATAAGNTSAFSQYFDVLLWFNLLLLGGLMLLVGGRLYRLRRHVRARIFGSRLMLRMVLMFALVAILPGAMVYTLSVQFLNRSIETWFDFRVDNALDRGLNLGNSAIEYQLADLARKARLLALDLLARLDAVAAIDADQFGDTPDQMVLEFVQLAVGVDDLPHQGKSIG